MRHLKIVASGALFSAVLAAQLVTAAQAQTDPAVAAAEAQLNAGCGGGGSDCLATVDAVLAGIANMPPATQLAIAGSIGAIAAANPALLAQIKALVDAAAASLGLPGLSGSFNVAAGLPADTPTQVPTSSSPA